MTMTRSRDGWERIARLVRSIAATVVCAMILSGCATNPPLSISSPPGRAVAGDTFLQVREATHLVRVRALTPRFSTRTSELPAFEVSVLNRGQVPLAFSPANVTVLSGAAPVRAYSASELMEKLQKEAERRAAEKSAESGEKIFQAPSTRGDPSAAIVMVEREKMMDRAREARMVEPEKLSELANMIVPVSISPGGTGSGVVKLHAEDIREDQPLRVLITMAGETYEFVFDVERR